MSSFLQLPKFMTVDIETTGTDWTTDQLHGVSIGYGEDDARYYRWDEIPNEVAKDLADPTIAKLGHNLHSFDAPFLKRFGFAIEGELDDTMIVWNLIDPDSALGLKYLSEQEFGPQSLGKKKDLDMYLAVHGCRHVGELCAKDLLDPTHPHTAIIAEYSVEDNLNTTRLFIRGMNKLNEMDKLLKGPKFGFKKSPLDYYYEEARPLERVLFDMEYRGVKVDMNVIESIRQNALSAMETIEGKLNKILAARIAKVEIALCEKDRQTVTSEAAKANRQPGKGKAKFKWGNNNHVGLLIYEFCDIPQELRQHTNKGKYKTDKAVIEMLCTLLPKSHVQLVNCLRAFAEYKQHSKIALTYTGTNKKGIYSKIRWTDGYNNFYRDSMGNPNFTPRIFPQYRQTTGTGRLACKNPNLQNLKRDSDVKKFFIPDDPSQVFDSADYSQIELRVAAELSQDPGLVNSYLTGEDVHLRTASRLFRKTVTKADDLERQAGKRTNFLTIFDGGPSRLMAALKADTGKDFSFEECKEFIRIWFETYPQVRVYLDTQIEFFKRFKFCISPFGRIRRLPDIVFGNKLRWIKDREQDRWVPRYEGTPEMRNKLLHRIKKANPKLPMHKITEDMIGWEASKRYKHAIKAGLNMPIQGGAASYTKRSMRKMYDLGVRIANQVHDELVVPRMSWDCHAQVVLIDTMTNIYKGTVPLGVDVKTLKSFHPKDKV